MKALLRLALAAGFAVFYAQPLLPGEAGAVEVHQKIMAEVPADSAPAREALARFFEAYQSQMNKKAKSAKCAGWDFWVVLAPDRNAPDRQILLVVAHAGGLTVRVAEIPANPASHFAAEAARIAGKSVQLTMDPFYAGLARRRGAVLHTAVQH